MEKKNFFKYLPKNKYADLLPALKSQKAQQFTTIVLTLIAIIFFSLFAINPTISTIIELQKQIEDSQFVNQKLSEKIVNLGILQQKYVELSSDIPTILAAIPPTQNSADFAAQIQAMAQQQNITITQLMVTHIDLYSKKTSVLKSVGGTTTFDFSLEVTGSYQQIKSFIKALSYFERIVSLENMSINNPEQNSTLYTASLKGTTYFKP